MLPALPEHDPYSEQDDRDGPVAMERFPHIPVGQIAEFTHQEGDTRTADEERRYEDLPLTDIVQPHHEKRGSEYQEGGRDDKPVADIQEIDIPDEEVHSKKEERRSPEDFPVGDGRKPSSDQNDSPDDHETENDLGHSNIENVKPAHEQEASEENKHGAKP